MVSLSFFSTLIPNRQSKGTFQIWIFTLGSSKKILLSIICEPDQWFSSHLLESCHFTWMLNWSPILSLFSFFFTITQLRYIQSCLNTSLFFIIFYCFLLKLVTYLTKWQSVTLAATKTGWFSNRWLYCIIKQIKMIS